MAKEFPDLTGDGKVTQADILKGRGAFAEGSLMVPREGYIVGGVAKSVAKLITEATTSLPKGKQLKEITDRVEYNRKQFAEGERDPFPASVETRAEIESLENLMSVDKEINSKIKKLKEKIFDTYKDKEVAEDIFLTKLEELYKKLELEGIKKAEENAARDNFAEGSLMVPVEMEVPVDTYNNLSPEEQAMELSSDSEMEDEYSNYIIEEVLTEDEQNYLLEKLDADEKLEDIINKVFVSATEFNGAGEVDGPGTGISDSIPARLSDGEFVFTKKAVDQIGADNLQMMMDDAEREFDMARETKAVGGIMNDPTQDEKAMLPDEAMSDDQIEEQMLESNRIPSLMRR